LNQKSSISPCWPGSCKVHGIADANPASRHNRATDTAPPLSP
jgi:hypothetical protein